MKIVRTLFFRHLALACDVVRLSHELALPVLQVAKVYLAVGSRFGFPWLRRAITNLQSDTAWNKHVIDSATVGGDGPIMGPFSPAARDASL